MLDLTFSEEQEMLRDTVRSLLAEHAPLTVAREMEDDPVGYPDELWKRMAELDLLGLLLPEEHGGSGMTALEGVVLYEELGRSLAPTPHFVSCVASGLAIARGGDAEQRSRWLPRIATGEAVLTPAWLEPDRGFGPEGVQTRATSDDGGETYVVTGVKRHVLFAAAATRLLVFARTGDGPEEIDLFLVDPQAPGVRLTQQRSVASDTQYRVDLEGVRVPAADRLGAPGSGWATWTAVRDDALIMLAAWAVGAAEHTQAMTVQYAKDREQFGKPIGAFQAIAHYLADRQTELDGARTLVHEAAWARATGRPTGRLAPMAKLFACRMFRDLTATAQQVHGGNGFTLEYDVQLFFRRAKALQLSWWGERDLEELIAADVLDG
ncbi:MAG: acyl-CoA dehydrogenase family protein [Thermoanaerobacterales bacterium]|jgi:alkylation response protein AidB-like acyl-CoA dehydrogenase|nr:acyl-CoA dehydrogenase [Thermoanaerobacterales bacterium]